MFHWVSHTWSNGLVAQPENASFAPRRLRVRKHLPMETSTVYESPDKSMRETNGLSDKKFSNFCIPTSPYRLMWEYEMCWMWKYEKYSYSQNFMFQNSNMSYSLRGWRWNSMFQRVVAERVVDWSPTLDESRTHQIDLDRWRTWFFTPMKDVASYDKPGRAACGHWTQDFRMGLPLRAFMAGNAGNWNVLVPAGKENKRDAASKSD